MRDMGQSKTASLIETLSLALISVPMNMLAAGLVFPFFEIELSLTSNWKATIFMVSFNIVIRYPVRRVFNAFTERFSPPAPSPSLRPPCSPLNERNDNGTN